MTAAQAKTFLTASFSADKFSVGQCENLLVEAQRLADLYAVIDTPGSAKNACPFEPDFATVLALKILHG